MPVYGNHNFYALIIRVNFVYSAYYVQNFRKSIRIPWTVIEESIIENTRTESGPFVYTPADPLTNLVIHKVIKAPDSTSGFRRARL